MKRKLVEAIILSVALFICGGIVGYQVKPVQYVDRFHYVPYEKIVNIEKPVYIEVEKPIYIDRPVPQIIEVEKPVYVEKVVEITKEVPIELREFESPEELGEWLEQDTLNSLPPVKNIFDCDDFAPALKRHAREDGYEIDLQYNSKGKLPMSNIVLKRAHNLCTTRIGNEVWFIEPMTDEHWMVYKID